MQITAAGAPFTRTALQESAILQVLSGLAEEPGCASAFKSQSPPGVFLSALAHVWPQRGRGTPHCYFQPADYSRCPHSLHLVGLSENSKQQVCLQNLGEWHSHQLSITTCHPGPEAALLVSKATGKSFESSSNLWLQLAWDVSKQLMKSSCQSVAL